MSKAGVQVTKTVVLDSIQTATSNTCPTDPPTPSFSHYSSLCETSFDADVMTGLSLFTERRYAERG